MFSSYLENIESSISAKQWKRRILNRLEIRKAVSVVDENVIHYGLYMMAYSSKQGSMGKNCLFYFCRLLLHGCESKSLLYKIFGILSREKQWRGRTIPPLLSRTPSPLLFCCLPYVVLEKPGSFLDRNLPVVPVKSMVFVYKMVLFYSASGNEAEHFIIKENTAANRVEAVAPPAPPLNWVTTEGITYVGKIFWEVWGVCI